jgi:hypothetical protein
MLDEVGAEELVDRREVAVVPHLFDVTPTQVLIAF